MNMLPTQSWIMAPGALTLRAASTASMRASPPRSWDREPDSEFILAFGLFHVAIESRGGFGR